MRQKVIFNLFRSNKLLLLLYIVTLLLVTCQAEPTREPGLPFETIASEDGATGNNVYRGGEPAIRVIADLEQARSLPNIGSERTRQRIRSLDYTQFFVIIVFHGSAGKTGYAVEVKSIVREDDKVYIKTLFTYPTPASIEHNFETFPYHIVAVKKSGSWNRSITFVLSDTGGVYLKNKPLEYIAYIPC